MTVKTSNSVRFWDRIAPKYARDPIKDMAGYETSLARTRDLIADRQSVLEIGCGTGTTALKLARTGQAYLATDVSPAMIGISEEKAAAEVNRNVIFGVAEPMTAPWLDSTFDAVLAFNVLHLVPERQAVLSQLYRVLAPGGLLISKTPCLKEMNPLIIKGVLPVMTVLGQAPFVSVFSASELERDLVRAGFELRSVERHGSGRKDERVFMVAQKP
ncbi:MAG: class I SAM-dependent methyltransferase [Asticcacaulis sp.]